MPVLKLRSLSLALSAALVLPSAFAGQAQPAAPVAQPIQQPLLWKVSDADNSVYLLGSFHLLKADDYPLPKEVDRAFDEAESLLFEVDPREMTAPETIAIIQKYAAYENGDSLSKVLPKATYDKLGNLISMTGGSVQALEQSEPWMVSLSLVLGITNAMGFKADLGLDRHLMARAATAGKPTAGLETIEDQMKAMDAVSHAEQAQGLDEFLADPKKSVQQLQDMHAWWRSGDVAKLDREMRADMATKTPESYKLLDVDRNNAWLPKVEARLKDSKGDDTLVVVGSLHLLGEDGLVEKLRAKGYAVERVCDGCVAPTAH
ncbi:MAG: TraB/GumN family protein [Lysobacteraceae bacterium]|nr:MAG: TraB/GumN family protein [Xanthomonadaceae bacterium]